MSLPTGGLLWLVVLLIVVAAFLTGAEAACTRMTPARARELLDAGLAGSASLVRVATDRRAPVLLTTNFLRVLADTAASVCLALVCLSWVPVWWEAALVAVLVITGLVFVVVGVGPRTYGRQNADLVGRATAPVLLRLTVVLAPLTRLLVLIGNAITPGQGYRDGPFASETELREVVDLAEQNQVIESGEREMIHSVIELGDTLTRELMVPRTDLVAVPTTASLRTAMDVLLRSGYSRVPVVGEDLDDVRGVLYLKDVARRLHENRGSVDRMRVGEMIRPAHFVPDSKPADDLLGEMRQRAVPNVAVVVDEYGGTAGLITLEDLVEEIVGEIADEYDVGEGEVEDLGGGRYRVSARMHVEDVGDLFDVELEDDDVDTVGGLLAKCIGRVPLAGPVAEVEGLRFTAERFEGRRHRLATVIAERVAPEEAP